MIFFDYDQPEYGCAESGWQCMQYPTETLALTPAQAVFVLRRDFVRSPGERENRSPLCSDRVASSESRRFVTGLLVVCLTIVSTGCESVRDSSITGRLWDADGVNRYLPAPQSNVRLYRTSDNQDVLVTYDELREKDDSIQRRAFFFRPNLRRLEGGKRPKFVNPASIVELKLVQVPEAIDTSTPGDGEIVATVSNDGQAFTLHWAGTQLGPYDLPVYADRGSGFKRVFLTPLMVMGDVIVVVVFVAVVAGMAVAYIYVSDCH